MKVPAVRLTRINSWVKIEADNALPETYSFMDKISNWCDSVCFGDSGLANIGNKAIKIERLRKFVSYCEKNKIEVYRTNEGLFTG